RLPYANIECQRENQWIPADARAMGTLYVPASRCLKAKFSDLNDRNDDSRQYQGVIREVHDIDELVVRKAARRWRDCERRPLQPAHADEGFVDGTAHEEPVSDNHAYGMRIGKKSHSLAGSGEAAEQ